MQGNPVPPNWRPTLQNWDSPPFNRWSFQNVRQILPTVPVRGHRGPASPLMANLKDLGDLTFCANDGVETTVETMLDDTYTDGFIVLVDGKIVTERYFNNMTPQTLHLAQSVSKSVVATVAGILIGRGVLDPMQPVTAYLPELARTAWNGARLQHVLDMTAGVRFNETYTDPDSDIAMTDIAAGWKPMPPGTAGLPQTIWDQILGLTEQDAAHGARFEYQSIQTDVLAHVMQRAAGKRLADLVSDELWQKLAPDEDAEFTVDRGGYALADGGFNACLRDFARFGLLHLNGGAVAGQQIVPPAFVANTRHGPHGLFNDAGRELLPNGCYRNQFWVEEQGRETLMALGVFGQMIYISPEYDMVAVKLSTWPEFMNKTHETNTLRALRAIASALGKP